ncbi:MULTISPECIES: SHOCT domain-containing protein [unclassified Frankia]|uniref:SHOCT domain-containing protein n=1 Tax=unclassified Frankia TaxID=2632575 RepID=UPI002AD3E376|nr:MULTISPECIES: SHOCT domain-containing protein [unclassified Frankia]
MRTTEGVVVQTHYQYPLLSVFWTMLWFFLFLLWFYLLFAVISDVLLSHDLSGWGKAAWIIFVILLPLFGILVYLIFRGDSMHERAARRSARQEEDFRDYVRTTAGTASPSEELSRLAELRDRGAISDAEFEQMKARVLA